MKSLGINMGYEELFPVNDVNGWHANAAKRFASPFVDNYHDRIDVDPIILSNAAVHCGFTIRDFYEKPQLGIHCVGYISELFDLLPVTHWFFSLPWVRDLGLTLEYKDTLPPVSTGPILQTPEDIEKFQPVPKEKLKTGPTSTLFHDLYGYVQKNLPHTLVPISYGFDLVGSAAEFIGVENFIMDTFTEPDLAHKLLNTYVETSINGADVLSDEYGMAMLIVGSVLANNDIFADEQVEEFSAKTMGYYVDQCFRKGAGPQVFYHLCGNHETDYKVFKKNLLWSPFNVLHIGYKGPQEFPSDLLKSEFQDVTTIMGSVDTKLMISANPKKVYDHAKDSLLKGRDAKKGFILGTSCETPPYSLPGDLLALTRAARDFGTYGTW
jgi:uroporphyrinogen decarboxylase